MGKKTFFERISLIVNESWNSIYRNLTDTISIPEEGDFVVNAFDMDGEAYTTYVKKINKNGYIIDWENNRIDFEDLSMISVARIADYLEANKK